jgi:hypothetical protein
VRGASGPRESTTTAATAAVATASTMKARRNRIRPPA